MNAAGQVWNAAKGVWESVSGNGGYNPPIDSFDGPTLPSTPTPDSTDWSSWIDNWSI
jgi:hypothetical protein